MRDREEMYVSIHGTPNENGKSGDLDVIINVSIATDILLISASTMCDEMRTGLRA